MKRRLSLHQCRWELRAPFRLARHTMSWCDAVVVEISEDGCIGRGEARGIYFVDETQESVARQILARRDAIEAGCTREELENLLSPGGARNALDCALWDLECQLSGRSIWSLTGVDPGPVTTAYTLGLADTPAETAEVAAAHPEFPLLKIKLDASDPVARMTAVREARPDAELIVDANQSFSLRRLRKLLPDFERLGVLMIEQPLRRGGDAALDDFRSPVPLCADESCLDRHDLEAVARRYQLVNIKLDKAGGLTEALALADAARERGLGLIVGNMMGTSLAMAPAFVVAQRCDFVDLDGPLWLACDRPGGMRYVGASLERPDPGFWGEPERTAG